MPATAAARGPTVWNRGTAARCTTHETGHTADAPTPTTCTSRADRTTAWQAAANCTRSSWRADDWAGPMGAVHRQSTTPTTPTNSSAEIRIHQIRSNNFRSFASRAIWRYVRTIRGDDRPGGAGRKDRGDQRGARGRVDGPELQRGAHYDHHHRGPPPRRTRRRTHQASSVHALGVDTAVGQGRVRRCPGLQGAAADQRQGREGHHLAGVSRKRQIQTLPDPDGRLLRMARQRRYRLR